MSTNEVKQVIQDIPLGSKIEVITKAGATFQVALKNYDSGRERKEFNGIVIPAIPEALILEGPTFGDWRLSIDELEEIAEVV